MQSKIVKVFVSRHGRPSMKKLFSQLSCDAELYIKSSVFDGYVLRKNKNNLNEKTKIKSLEPIDCRNSIVIRWGWHGEILTDNTTITYNTADAIKLVNDKGRCRKVLEEAGLDVPKTFLLDEIEAAHRNNLLIYPMIGRPSHHGRGIAFFECNNYQEIQDAIRKGCSYFSYFYPKTREFGVHIGSSKILNLVEKPKPKDDKIAWNRYQNDEPFISVPWSEYKNYICKLALRTMKVCGLTYGRVDIMSNPTDKNLPKAVVCEANTAPTINSSDYTMERWVKYINFLANHEGRFNDWDFEQFENPKSLAWKNNQLEV